MAYKKVKQDDSVRILDWISKGISSRFKSMNDGEKAMFFSNLEVKDFSGLLNILFKNRPVDDVKREIYNLRKSLNNLEEIEHISKQLFVCKQELKKEKVKSREIKKMYDVLQYSISDRLKGPDVNQDEIVARFNLYGMKKIFSAINNLFDGMIEYFKCKTYVDGDNLQWEEVVSKLQEELYDGPLDELMIKERKRQEKIVESIEDIRNGS